MSNAEVFPIVEVPAGAAAAFIVKPISGNYTAQASDSGKTLYFNSASPATLTLPAYPPSSDWIIAVSNAGSGAVTIARNGRTIDGAASDLVLAQHQGCTIQPDGLNYITVRGVGGGGLAGVNAQAGDYTADGTDNGKLLVMSKTTAKALTLPVSPPSTTWAIFVQNTGAGDLTVNRNGLSIDGAAANLTLVQGEGLVVFTDGSNYFTERGISLVKSVAARTGDVTLAESDISGLVSDLATLTTAIAGKSPALARTTAAIDAGTLAANASAVGSVTMCKSGFLFKAVAAAKSWLRLYKTAAGRDADLARAYGTVPTDVGLLVELAWLGTAPLTWEMQQDAILENGDGSPATTIYWSVFNRETGSTHQTYTLTFMGIET